MKTSETSIFDEYTDDEVAFIPVEEFFHQVSNASMDHEDTKFLRNYDDE